MAEKVSEKVKKELGLVAKYFDLCYNMHKMEGYRESDALYRCVSMMFALTGTISLKHIEDKLDVIIKKLEEITDGEKI